jgi:microcystin-dependent protein
MTAPFLGEIRIFAGNFAPRGWALCNGQLLPIAQNTALFALLGTTYGGDGRTNFALPNLQGAAPLHAGQGPGLSNYALGQTGGETQVTLLNAQLASHTHPVLGTSTPGTAVDPGNAVWGVAAVARGTQMYADNPGSGAQMNPLAFSPSGGNQPHNNLPPYLTLTFIIALQGIFPARN